MACNSTGAWTRIGGHMQALCIRYAETCRATRNHGVPGDRRCSRSPGTPWFRVALQVSAYRMQSACMWPPIRVQAPVELQAIRALRRIGMPGYLKVAAAQMGPNQDGTPREAIVERMLALLDAAARDGVELIVYPEMALTTYFPKRIRSDFDQFFETEVPPKALEPLLRRAAAARVAVHVGFCEKADDQYFNTALLTDRDGRLCGTFRKIHLPGTKAPDGFAQVFEPYYFAHGDTGYKVFDAAGARVGIAICQDRRYPESYRALALQGAEVILVGYNTPSSPLALDLNELCLRSGAYANLCFVVGVAKAGVEDCVELIAGSAIVSPLGQVLARAATNGDELVVARIDLDQMIPLRKRWNFLGRRQPQHYGRLLEPVTEREPHR